jgi:hypothetical protein
VGRYTYDDDGEPAKPRMRVVRSQDPPKKSSCLGVIVVLGASAGMIAYGVARVVLG